MTSSEDALVGVGGIADLLGKTRQWAHKLTQREDFPASIAEIGGRRIWRTSDVEQWAASHRKLTQAGDGDA